MNTQKIIVDGVEYNLDVQSAIAAGNMKRIQTYKSGDMFYVGGNHLLSILVLVSYRTYALIDLKDGNRWVDAIKLPDTAVDGKLDIEFIKRLAGQAGERKLTYAELTYADNVRILS